MFPFIRLHTYLQLYDFQIRIKYWMLQAGMRIWAEMPLSAIGLAILSLALHSHLKISGWSSISKIDLEFRQKSWKFIKGFGPIVNSNRLEYSTGRNRKRANVSLGTFLMIRLIGEAEGRNCALHMLVVIAFYLHRPDSAMSL